MGKSFLGLFFKKERKESPYFLKKRSKKLLFLGGGLTLGEGGLYQTGQSERW
jgi:hypothetical protein